jgi:aminoglycoside phosphotransferase family enzyme/predicted kinase
MVTGPTHSAKTQASAMRSDDGDQAEVIRFLADPASHVGVNRVERFETHGNLVFLAGPEAWKIKRAVRFPYMDFSTLEKRRAACAREVEVNRRFAPELYFASVPIRWSRTGTLRFGGAGRVVEWAVHMRRFEQDALLSNLVKRGEMTGETAKELADVVYASHAGAEPAGAREGVEPIRRLAHKLAGSLLGSRAFADEDVRRFSQGVDRHLGRYASILDERARRGCVRRCHGDVHLANIVMWHGHPVLYDAIEFDEAIATIDTLYDLAFLLMDLDRQGQRPAANIVLNRYLWRSRDDLDLQGLASLPLFLALRAGVRAMVTVDRAAQENARERAQDLDRARGYLAASLRYLEPSPPRLVAVGGLSGTGKTTLAAALAPRLGACPGAVHLGSDLERKALAGTGELERLPESAYAPDARRRIYEVLLSKARMVLGAGQAVIVDAVYAGEEERRAIEAVAAELHVPFRGLWLTAGAETLIGRVKERSRDASDATTETVAKQLRSERGPLSHAWIEVEAGGTPRNTLDLAASALALDAPTERDDQPHDRPPS